MQQRPSKETNGHSPGQEKYARVLIVVCLAYISNMKKTEAVRSCETSINFYYTTRLSKKKVILVIITAVRTSVLHLVSYLDLQEIL
jgi:hypothetical protein